MARFVRMPRKQQRKFYAGIAARSLLGGSTPPAGDLVDVIVIDEDTGEAFPDVTGTSFVDASFIFTDSGTPANNKSSKAGISIEDFYQTEPPNTLYPAVAPFSRSEDGCPHSVRHNGLNYSRDFSQSAWTKSSVTYEYLTGEYDRWGDEKVQRITFTGGAGGDQYIKQSIAISQGIRHFTRATFAYRMALGETCHFVWRNGGDTSDKVTKQLTGTGDWVYDFVDHIELSTAGYPKFMFQSKSGDTADTIDVMDLGCSSQQGTRHYTTNYNDTTVNGGRFYLPFEFDAAGERLGLRFFDHYNIDGMSGATNYGGGLGQVAMNGNSTNMTRADESYTAMGYWNKPEGTTAYNSEYEYWTKHTETVTDAAHYAYVRTLSGNNFQTLNADTTASVVLKKGTRRYLWVQLRVDDSNHIEVMVDMDNGGAITDEQTTGTKLTNLDIITREYPNGGVWVSFLFQLTDGTSGEYIYMNGGTSETSTFAAGDPDSSNRPTFAGSTSEYFYSSAPDYFKNVKSDHMPGPVTHGTNGDLTSDMGVYRLLSEMTWHATDGTVVLTFTPQALPSSGYVSWFVFVGEDAQVSSGANYIKIGWDENGNARFKVRSSNVDQCDLTSVGTITLNAENKIAVSWEVDGFALSLNGETAVTDSSGQIPAVSSAFENFWLGSHGGTNRSNSYAALLLSDFLYVPQKKNANWLKNRSSVA